MEARGREHKRNRQQKPKSGKYGQSFLKHSRKGIQSCLCAVFALGILAWVLAMAFVTRGDVAGVYGGIALVSVVLPVLGIRLGIRGLYERERRYLTCKIGIVLNILPLLMLAIIFYGGL